MIIDLSPLIILVFRGTHHLIKQIYVSFNLKILACTQKHYDPGDSCVDIKLPVVTNNVLKSSNNIIQTCWAWGQSLFSSSNFLSTFQATEWAFPRSHTSSPSHPQQDSALPRHARFMTCWYDANRLRVQANSLHIRPVHAFHHTLLTRSAAMRQTKKKKKNVTHR